MRTTIAVSLPGHPSVVPPVDAWARRKNRSLQAGHALINRWPRLLRAHNWMAICVSFQLVAVMPSRMRGNLAKFQSSCNRAEHHEQ